MSDLKRFFLTLLRLLKRLSKARAGAGGNAEARETEPSRERPVPAAEGHPPEGRDDSPADPPPPAAGAPDPASHPSGIAVAISSGHGARISGAVGVLNEVVEARRVVTEVARLLREMGACVHEFHDDESTTVAANIGAIVGWHNSRERDIDVSVHFNAFRPTDGPMGTEVLHLAEKDAAAALSRAMAAAAGFRDRGAKFRDDLGFLNRAAKPAVLLEVCFVDSAEDARLYLANFDAVCRAIAETLREPPIK